MRFLHEAITIIMMFGSGGGAGYALHTDDDEYDDLDLPPYMGSFNFGESDPDLVEGVEVVDGEPFFNAAMAPVDHQLSSSTIATDDVDGVMMEEPSLLLEPSLPNDYEVDSASSTLEANATEMAARTDVSSPSLHTELDLATGSTKMVQSPPVSMSQRMAKGTIAAGTSTSALAAAALVTEFHRLDSISTRNNQDQSVHVDHGHSDSAERNVSGAGAGGASESGSEPPPTHTKTGGKRKAAAVAAATGIGMAGLATIAVYGNRILKRFRDDDGDNEEAANYEVQDQDFGGDIYAQQQGQGPAQAQPQAQGQGPSAQGPTGAEQGAAQAGQAMAQTQLQVAQAMVAQASSGIASSAGAVGGAAGAAAAAAAAATAAGKALFGHEYFFSVSFCKLSCISDRYDVLIGLTIFGLHLDYI